MGDVFSSIGNAVGSIGGVTNGLAKGFTPQNEFNAGDPINQQAMQQQIATSQGNLAQTNTNQNALAQALLARSQGQGPNPAQDMLNQSTNQNVQQNAGMIASQKGINPALAARQASLNAASMNQQAAGQGAVMGANQQIAAQQGLSNLYGQQANQSLQNISTSGGLANQGALGAAGINAGTSAQNAAATQTTNSGFLNSIAGAAKSAAAGMFHGGEVKNYDSGGAVQPFQTGDFGKSNASAQIANGMLNAAGVHTYQTGVSPINLSMTPSIPKPQDVAGGAGDAGGSMGADGGGLSGFSDLASGAGPAAMAYSGGKIPAHLHAVAKIYHPQAFQQQKGTTQLKAQGGKVPGKAKVPGDSPKNDTVKTMLSPGEVVIPRSVMNSKDPAAEAAKFVASKLKEKDGSNAHGDFKEALKNAIKSRKGA